MGGSLLWRRFLDWMSWLARRTTAPRPKRASSLALPSVTQQVSPGSWLLHDAAGQRLATLLRPLFPRGPGVWSRGGRFLGAIGSCGHTAEHVRCEPPALAAVLAGEDSSVRRGAVGRPNLDGVGNHASHPRGVSACRVGGRSGSDLVCESRRLSSIGHVAAGFALAALIDRFGRIEMIGHPKRIDTGSGRSGITCPRQHRRAVP